MLSLSLCLVREEMIYLTASRSAPALVVTLSCFAANSLLKGSCSIHLQGALTRLSEFDVFFFFLLFYICCNSCNESYLCLAWWKGDVEKSEEYQISLFFSVIVIFCFPI